MRIAVDAMGGDRAPSSVIEGALWAARDLNGEIILVGDQCRIERELANYKDVPKNVTIVHAPQVVEMTDSPVEACRKKPKSSIMIAANMVGKKEADAFVSAGHSGAIVTASLMCIGRLSGISRPAIATYLPNKHDFCVLLDVGANVDCKSKHLYQFAIMGETYVKYIYKKRMPRVALLNIGGENTKGNESVIEAYKMLSKSEDINFIGNIEGRDIPLGKADVIVCDGFVGNVVLKFGEGVAEFMVDMVKDEISRNPLLVMSALFLKKIFRKIKKRIDFAEYGGAPLLGIDGICIITHGVADAKAISNSIKAAVRSVDQNINEHIKDKI